jgi:hypothetical protein
MTYTKLLEQWRTSKEDEAASRGSAFGIVKRIPMATAEGKEEAVNTAGTAESGGTQPNTAKSDGTNRKSSVLDDK